MDRDTVLEFTEEGFSKVLAALTDIPEEQRYFVLAMVIMNF